MPPTLSPKNNTTISNATMIETSTILFSKNSEVISEMDIDDPKVPELVLGIESGSIIRNRMRLIPTNRTESTHK
jgi:hypothetical protein